LTLGGAALGAVMGFLLLLIVFGVATDSGQAGRGAIFTAS
jgi:hypothetical protein